MASTDPWDTIVRKKWMELRVRLDPSELRHALVNAKLITTAESMELDPVIGLGKPKLNDRLYSFLMGSGRRGFNSFVCVLQQFGSQYRDVLLLLGQEPGPDIVGPDTSEPNTRRSYEVTTAAERVSESSSARCTQEYEPMRQGDPLPLIGNSTEPVREMQLERRSNIWEEIFKNHFDDLENSLQPDDLANACLKEGLINEEAFEIMKNARLSRQERNRELLTKLRGSDKRGLLAFYEILQSKGLPCEFPKEILTGYVERI